MNDAEHNCRLEALAHAIRHKAREEKPEHIVAAAKKYLAFLLDKTVKSVDDH